MRNAPLSHISRLLSLLILAGPASRASTVSAGIGVWTAGSTGVGSIKALAIDPLNPATLYAAGGSVFKSTNAGETWMALDAGPTGGVGALVIDPANPATLYAAAGGVFKSTDGGESWTAINMGLTAGVGLLAIDPSNTATIYSAGSGGVFKSSNGGESWTAVSAGLTNHQVNVLAIDPSAPATLYGGTSYSGVLYKSTNGGGSWTPILLVPTEFSALSIDPSAPSNIYAGTSSFDWPPGGLFRSTDGGANWTGNLLDRGDVRALAIDPSAPATLYAGTSTGVFKSTNRGESWTDIGLTNLGVVALAVNPSAPATLYAGTSGAGVFKSSDGGRSWTPINTGLNAPITTALLPTSAHSPGARGAFYTTNVSVANVGVATALFTMKFLGHDQDGSAGPERTFGLDAGASVTYVDVLGTVFDQTSNYGAIRITSSSSSLRIVTVTSTPGFGGTLSQTIPAVSSTDLIHAGSARSILYIREGDGFRSNLVLASNAGVSTTVDAVLVSPEGAILAAKDYSVPPNGMTQINRVVRDMGVSGSITGARLVLSSSTPEAAFTAFASVIDEVTNDPTAVEAK